MVRYNVIGSNRKKQWWVARYDPDFREPDPSMPGIELYGRWIKLEELGEFKTVRDASKAAKAYVEEHGGTLDSYAEMHSKRASELKKASAQDLSYLKQYLTMSPRENGEELARAYSGLFKEFLEESHPDYLNLLDEEGWIDNFDTIPDAVLTEFLDGYSHKAMEWDPAYAPTFLTVEYKGMVNNAWLVHFSDHVDKIAREGFKVGMDRVDNLALTTYFKDEAKAMGGYNFALDKDNRNLEGLGKNYGKDCVLFQATGVKTYHYGDEFEQIIFWGKDAKNIIPIYSDGYGTWSVSDADGNDLYQSSDLHEVCDWAIANFASLRPKKAPAKKKSKMAMEFQPPALKDFYKQKYGLPLPRSKDERMNLQWKFDEAVGQVDTLEFPLTVYRALEVPSGQPVNLDGAGVFWTTNPDAADAYWGGSSLWSGQGSGGKKGRLVTITAEVQNENDVDPWQTFVANFENPDEYEVTLREGAQLKLVKIDDDEPSQVQPGQTITAKIAAEPYEQPRREYSPYPKIIKDEKGNAIFEDETDEQARERYRKQKDWDQLSLAAVSEGKIDQEVAKERGLSLPGQFKPMPETLYHVTTAMSAVQAGGLKTRYQLQMAEGTGLGGGTDMAISFTDDLQTAKGIYFAMVEAKKVASGGFSVAEMLEQAKAGTAAKRSWLVQAVTWGGAYLPSEKDWSPGKPFPVHLQALLEGKKVQNIDTYRGKTQEEMPGADPVGEGWQDAQGKQRWMYWRVPLSQSELIDRTFDFYKTWSTAREDAGGPLNPLFFSSNIEALAQVPDEQIGILQFKPRPGALGTRVSALGEWRTYSGLSVQLVGTVDPYGKVASMSKRAFYIEVPPDFRDGFWKEVPVEQERYWAYKGRPILLAGETVYFTFDAMPVAECVCTKIEEPNNDPKDQYGGYYKVYWTPDKFKKYGAAKGIKQFANELLVIHDKVKNAPEYVVTFPTVYQQTNLLRLLQSTVRELMSRLENSGKLLKQKWDVNNEGTLADDLEYYRDQIKSIEEDLREPGAMRSKEILNIGINTYDEILQQIHRWIEKWLAGGKQAATFASVTGDNATWKGKPFVMGAASVLDGVIEEVHDFAECDGKDWHHSYVFSSQILDKTWSGDFQSGEYAIFWVDDAGQIRNMFGLPDGLIPMIRQQIKIIPRKSPDPKNRKVDFRPDYGFSPSGPSKRVKSAMDETIDVLYHGTCPENAKAMLENGWQPNQVSPSANQGQSKYLYLTNMPENAVWFAQERGCDTVLEIRDVPISSLLVDPEDGVYDTVAEELGKADMFEKESSRPMMAGSVVLTKPLDASHFRIYSVGHRDKTAAVVDYDSLMAEHDAIFQLPSRSRSNEPAPAESLAEIQQTRLATMLAHCRIYVGQSKRKDVGMLNEFLDEAETNLNEAEQYYYTYKNTFEEHGIQNDHTLQEALRFQENALTKMHTFITYIAPSHSEKRGTLSTRWYHGTSAENAKKILAEGEIKPGQTTIYNEDMPRQNCVYVTSDLDVAELYASEGGRAGVVLEVKIDPNKLIPDEDDVFELLEEKPEMLNPEAQKRQARLRQLWLEYWNQGSEEPQDYAEAWASYGEAAEAWYGDMSGELAEHMKGLVDYVVQKDPKLARAVVETHEKGAYPGSAKVVRQIKTAAARQIYYHGTVAKNLRPILTEGLVPEGKQKSWADDPSAGMTSPSRQAYGGIYLTRNLMTAIGAPRDNKSAPDYKMVLVIVEAQPNSLFLDEDSIVGILDSPYGNYNRDTSEMSVGESFMMTLPNAPESMKEILQNQQAAYTENVIKQLKHQLEQNQLTMAPDLEKRVRELLPDVFLASLTRRVSHAYVSDPKRIQEAGYDARNYDYKRAYQRIMGDHAEAPPKDTVIPTPQAGEERFRLAAEQLTRTLRTMLRIGQAGGWSFQNARTMESIGYSGSNHITGVLEILDGRGHRIEYNDPEGWQGKGSMTPIIVHYGNVPEDFNKQWNERVGSKIYWLKPGETPPPSTYVKPPEPEESNEPAKVDVGQPAEPQTASKSAVYKPTRKRYKLWHGGDPDLTRVPTYFTNNRKYAQDFGEVVQAYVIFNNPLVLNAMEGGFEAEETHVRNAQWRQEQIEKGYDGLIVVGSDAPDMPQIEAYVPFSASQIQVVDEIVKESADKRWLEGGCFDFARALKQKLPEGQYVGLYLMPPSFGYFVHAGVQVGDKIWDARGAQSQAEFMKRNSTGVYRESEEFKLMTDQDIEKFIYGENHEDAIAAVEQVLGAYEKFAAAPVSDEIAINYGEDGRITAKHIDGWATGTIEDRTGLARWFGWNALPAGDTGKYDKAFVLGNITVKAAARRTGLGRSLMSTILDEAKAQGAEVCFLLAQSLSGVSFNELREFYGSVGFTVFHENILMKKLAGMAKIAAMNRLSQQDAIDRKMFGPVYHGTTEERREQIGDKGFVVFEGEAGSGDIQHGYEGNQPYHEGIPAPVHHLGYGVYFTTVKAIAKTFQGGTTRGMKTYYLDVPNIETINFGVPKTMMKWWISQGYDPQLAKTDRVAATKKLTDNLKSKYDAVWFKGKGLRKLLDGDQICVFDPSKIYEVDASLTKPGDIGSKVQRNADGMKGVIRQIRPLAEDIGKQYHGGATRMLEVKWQKGGVDYNVYDRDITFLDAKGKPVTSSKTAASEPLPLDPGTAPIPPGTVRCFHYTQPGNVQSILQSGLLKSKGRGDDNSYGGPSAGVWASSQVPDYSSLNTHTYIEFWVTPEQISRNANYPQKGEDATAWGKNREQHMIMYGDIPPNQIVAVHEPWHQHAHYLAENWDEINSTIHGFDIKSEEGAQELDKINAKEEAQAIRWMLGNKTASEVPKGDISTLSFEPEENNDEYGGWTINAWAPNRMPRPYAQYEGPVGFINIGIEGASIAGPYVYDITVEDAYRGTGLGQKLYDLAIAEAKKRGYKEFNSSIDQTPEAKAAWKRLAQRYPVTKKRDKTEKLPYFSMKIAEGFNDEGFWAGEGNAASGVLPICSTTKRICLAWRSPDVHIGDCWGTIGGAVKPKMSLADSAKAELKEETGFAGGVTMIPAYVFSSGSFSYHNFVGVVPSEFTFHPQSEHHWETTGLEWFTLDEINEMMKTESSSFHPGVIALWKNSYQIIEQHAGAKKTRMQKLKERTDPDGIKEAATFAPLYHGTSSKFDVFRTRRTQYPGGGMSLGAYFTANPEVAKRFAHGPNAEIKKVELTLDNPLDLRGKTYQNLPEVLPWLDESSKWQCKQSHAGMYSVLEMLNKRSEFVPKLKKRGYDGIIFDESVEGTTYVAFYPNQIKMAAKTTLYHGSRKKFKPGDILTPQPGGYVTDPEPDVELHEDIVELHRPKGALPRKDSVYMVDDPALIDYAGGYEDYVYAVEPMGVIEKNDMDWYSELSTYIWDSIDDPEAGRLADGYWSGKAKGGEHTLFEYRAPKARIVKLISSTEEDVHTASSPEGDDKMPTILSYVGERPLVIDEWARKPYEQRKAEMQQAPLQEYDPGIVKTDQSVLVRKDFEYFTENPELINAPDTNAGEEHLDHPLFIDTDEGLFVFDGNHRTAAALELGQKILARIIDLRSWEDGEKTGAAGWVGPVYHGTDKKFTQFEQKPGTRYILFKEFQVQAGGFFFTDDKEYAAEFGSNIMTCYLRMKKPLVKEDQQYNLSKKQIKDLTYICEPCMSEGYSDMHGNQVKMIELGAFAVDVDPEGNWLNEVVKPHGLDWNILDNQEAVNRMKSLGYDSTMVDEENGKYSYFVISPDQIRIAQAKGASKTARTMTVYHGTPHIFDEFQPTTGKRTLWGLAEIAVGSNAYFFTPDYQTAANWAENRAGNNEKKPLYVLTCQITLNNPVDFTNPTWIDEEVAYEPLPLEGVPTRTPLTLLEVLREYTENQLNEQDWKDMGIDIDRLEVFNPGMEWKLIDSKPVMDALRFFKYDGAICDEGNSPEFGGKSYCVFSPSQIKIIKRTKVASQFPTFEQVMDESTDTNNEFDMAGLEGPEELYRETLTFWQAQKFPLVVYRALSLNEGDKIRYEDAGLSWSLNRDEAISVAADLHSNDDIKVLEGTILSNAVDWVDTFRCWMTPLAEQEVRLKPGAGILAQGRIITAAVEIQ